jgi:hypothetical protein
MRLDFYWAWTKQTITDGSNRFLEGSKFSSRKSHLRPAETRPKGAGEKTHLDLDQNVIEMLGKIYVVTIIYKGVINDGNSIPTSCSSFKACQLNIIHLVFIYVNLSKLSTILPLHLECQNAA